MNKYLTHKEFISLAEEILGSGNQLSFTARGSSMSPFIRNGDTVTLASCGDLLSVGDVVLFKAAEHRMLLHRVVKKQQMGILTMGDTSDSDDGFIPFNNVLGKVIRVSGGGYNFHIKTPFKFLIGKRIIFSRNLCKFPFILKFGKKIADALG